MKDIILTDCVGSEDVRMCEYHFKIYKKHMDKALEGGMNYSFSTSKERGCILCRRKKAGASRWCGPMFKIYRAMKSI
jgi:hypothetical protein